MEMSWVFNFLGALAVFAIVALLWAAATGAWLMILDHVKR